MIKKIVFLKCTKKNQMNFLYQINNNYNDTRADSRLGNK